MTTVTIKDVKKFKKLDLHRHLGGDVNPATLIELIENSGIVIRYGNRKVIKTEEDIFRYLDYVKKRYGIEGILTKGFRLVNSVMQTPYNLQTVAYEEVRNLYLSKVVYAEVRFGPRKYSLEGFQSDHMKAEGTKIKAKKLIPVIKAISRGLLKGEKDFGVKTKIILSIGRDASETDGLEIAKAAIATQRNNTVGIDISGNEAIHTAEPFLNAYKKTFTTKLYRTAHAGEFGPQKYSNMKFAINSLKCDRIGHAIDLAKYNDLVSLVASRKIGIEMAPESNIFTGIIKNRRQLKIVSLLKRGVKITLNSDNPALFGYSLDDTIYRTAKEYSMNLRTLELLRKNSIDVSFTTPFEKEKLQELVENR